MAISTGGAAGIAQGTRGQYFFNGGWVAGALSLTAGDFYAIALHLGQTLGHSRNVQEWQT